jgi:hypothetical protein
MTDKIEFVFRIYEIANKHIAETYVNDASNKMDQLSIKYNFQLINEEDGNKIMFGGSDSTYPYNLFESVFDGISNRVRGVVPKIPSVSLSARKGIFDRIFSSFKTEPSSSEDKVVSSEDKVVSTSIVEPNVDFEKSVGYDVTQEGEPIVFPVNYTGVVIVHLTIYDSGDSYQSVGGIKQFEHWLEERIINK